MTGVEFGGDCHGWERVWYVEWSHRGLRYIKALRSGTVEGRWGKESKVLFYKK